MVLNCTWLAIAALVATANAAPEPFSRYPGGAVYAGRHAPLRAADARSRRFRSALADAADGEVDFAGRFVMAEVGCGAGCVDLAAVDAATGAVVWFPWSVSNWPRSRIEPVDYRRDSRLIVVYGQLGERGSRGPHRFVLDRHRFRPLPASGE